MSIGTLFINRLFFSSLLLFYLFVAYCAALNKRKQHTTIGVPGGTGAMPQNYFVPNQKQTKEFLSITAKKSQFPPTSQKSYAIRLGC